jgi:lysophospholipase L1-like esterase
MDKKIENVDKNMKVETTGNDGLNWIDPRISRDVRVLGFNWFEEDHLYRRFGMKDQGTIDKIGWALNTLVGNTAGGAIAFYSDTSTLKIKVELSFKFWMSHMAYTGQAGFDLYVGTSPSDLKFYRSSTFDFKNDQYEFTFFENMKGGHLFVLNFPLYASVKEVLIGISSWADIRPGHDFETAGRMVFYGTSITQGGCASRPGMAYPAIIGRRMGYECLNYGFSGNGFGEKEIAHILASIHDVNLFVLDYEANAGGADLKLEKTLVPFIEEIRETYKTVPILVLSKIHMYLDTFHDDGCKIRERLFHYAQDTVAELNSQGDRNLYFHDGSNLLGNDYTECTVDGIHPTDLGFMAMAVTLIPVLTNILSKK